MGCPLSTVPGMVDADRVAKLDRGLEIKMEVEMDANQNAGPSFKEDTGYSPKNVVKAYKLFRYKNGKLYPLFVQAKKAVPLNKWLKAESGDTDKDGRVKSGIGSLSYRPGWHAGDMPIATHIGGKVIPETGQRTKEKGFKASMRENNTVWAEVEMPNDYDWQSVANSNAPIVKSGPNKGKLLASKAEIKDRIPYNGLYRYKTNPNMTGEWLISGNMKVTRILTDEEVRSINNQFGVADLPRDYEMPYFNRR